MGLSLPFASFHACANGYCYGSQKSRVPAFSQVAEQVVRMSLVFLIAGKWAAEGTEITVRLAVYGHLIGEIGAASFNLLCLVLFPPQRQTTNLSAEIPDSAASSRTAPSTPQIPHSAICPAACRFRRMDPPVFSRSCPSRFPSWETA